MPYKDPLMKKNYLREWTKRRASTLRDRLRVLLGGQCSRCQGTKKLEFCHFPGTRAWEAKKLNLYRRMLRYTKDYKKGQLLLMCRKCHQAWDRKQIWMNSKRQTQTPVSAPSHHKT